MDTVPQMDLPKNQDIVLDVGSWTTGPLPDQQLEQIAFTLFRDRYTAADWANPVLHAERHRYRQMALRLRVEYLKLDRWTLGTAGEKLTDELCQLLFGDPCVNTKARLAMQDFAESVIEDAAKLFTGDRSASWKYVPEDEPDDSEIEIVKKDRVQ